MPNDTDDRSLLRSLAQIMGWEVRESPTWKKGYDFSKSDVYLDIDGSFWCAVQTEPRDIRFTFDNGSFAIPWRPLHSMDDAWEIAVMVETWGYWVDVGLCNGKYGPEKRASCMIGEYGDGGRTIAEAFDDDPRRAICEAALKAYGVDHALAATREEGQ